MWVLLYLYASNAITDHSIHVPYPSVACFLVYL